MLNPEQSPRILHPLQHRTRVRTLLLYFTTTRSVGLWVGRPVGLGPGGIIVARVGPLLRSLGYDLRCGVFHLFFVVRLWLH